MYKTLKRGISTSRLSRPGEAPIQGMVKVYIIMTLVSTRQLELFPVHSLALQGSV